MITVVAFGVSLLLVVASILYHKHNQYRSDSPKIYLIFQTFSNFGDLWTDIIFATILLFSSDDVISELGYYSVGFTLIPHLISLIVGLTFLIGWHAAKQDRLTIYLSKYDVFIVGATLTAGFYSAIEIVTSKAITYHLFYLPLKRREYEQIKHFRFVNIILLES